MGIHSTDLLDIKGTHNVFWWLTKNVNSNIVYKKTKKKAALNYQSFGI